MPKPLPVSVIIPTLNEESHIEGLLQKLLQIPGIEIIVSDGGSQDNTRAICASYPVILVESATGRGPQLNKGADIATGNILFFIHADAEIEPQLILQMRKAVDAGHQWGCCTLRFDDKRMIFRLIAWQSNLRTRILSSCYGDQGIYCSRDLFYDAGTYPPTVFLEDIGMSDILRRKSRAWVLKGIITSSSRRFKKHGVFRTVVKMQMVKIMYRLGVKPERLIEWYNHTDIEVSYENSRSYYESNS